MAKFIDSRAMLTVLRQLFNDDVSRDELTFMVGAPLSRDGARGVADTKGMIEICREICQIELGVPVAEFDEAITHESVSQQYQAAFDFLHGRAARADEITREVVRAGVRKAYHGSEDRDEDAENDLQSWDIPPATDALARILVHASERCRTVITTNYDPLLSIAIRKLGRPCMSRVVTLEGTLPTLAERIPGAIQIIYLHGYWTQDTWHTDDQLAYVRTYLEASLFDHLQNSTLIAIAYGGWSDAFTRALAQLAPHGRRLATNILWGFYGEDEAVIGQQNRELLASVGALSQDIRFRAYKNISCHDFLPELAYHLLDDRDRPNLEPPPPSRLITTPVTNPNSLQSYLIRYLAYELWIHAKDMMCRHGFNDSLVRDILRGRAYTLIHTDPLVRVAVTVEIFRSTADANAYLRAPPHLPPLVDEIERSKQQINPATDSGARLLRLLSEFQARIGMVDQWKAIVAKYRPNLSAAGSDPNPHWRSALEEIYFRAATTWSIEQMRHFVRSDFDNQQWINVVENAQAALPEHELNHLHHANCVIGETLARLFERERRHAPAREQRDKFVVVEGGVGGANTTHQVLMPIVSSMIRTSQVKPIKYIGFEINELIAIQSEIIIRGECKDADGKPDPRSQFFEGLDSRMIEFGDVRRDECRFVRPVDLFDGVESLAHEPAYQGIVDLFLCSYAFHHVPNGREIRKFIFGPWSKKHIDPNSAEGRQFYDHVCGALRYWLDPRNLEPRQSGRAIPSYEPPPNARSAPAEVFLGFLPLERLATRCAGFELRLLLSDFESAFKAPRPDRMPHEWAELFRDHQDILLGNVWKLLRPGGMIAIADPDGYSGFNRTFVPETPEMGVAHFLNVAELLGLLRHRGFEIEFKKVQHMRRLGEPGGKFVLEEPDALVTADIDDPNRGYIVIARKPIDAGHAADVAPYDIRREYT